MAALEKPRTHAFVLDKSKSEQFFAQKEYTSEKALSRIMKHKAMIESLAFTEEEKTELENAREMTIVYDEDCPETTPEKALKFRRVNPRRWTY